MPKLGNVVTQIFHKIVRGLDRTQLIIDDKIKPQKNKYNL